MTFTVPNSEGTEETCLPATLLLSLGCESCQTHSITHTHLSPVSTQVVTHKTYYAHFMPSQPKLVALSRGPQPGEGWAGTRATGPASSAPSGHQPPSHTPMATNLSPGRFQHMCNLKAVGHGPCCLPGGRMPHPAEGSLSSLPWGRRSLWETARCWPHPVRLLLLPRHGRQCPLQLSHALAGRLQATGEILRLPWNDTVQSGAPRRNPTKGLPGCLAGG